MNVAALAGVVALALCGAVRAQPADYSIAPTHTFVTIELLHGGLSTQRVRFDRKHGSVRFDRAGRSGHVDLTLHVDSLNSGVPAFDATLKGREFFDVAQHPTAHFAGDGFVFAGDRVTEVSGRLTLRGRTEPLTLKALNFNCYNNPLFKRPVCGGDFEATLLRSQWGMARCRPPPPTASGCWCRSKRSGNEAAQTLAAGAVGRDRHGAGRNRGLCARPRAQLRALRGPAFRHVDAARPLRPAARRSAARPQRTARRHQPAHPGRQPGHRPGRADFAPARTRPARRCGHPEAFFVASRFRFDHGMLAEVRGEFTLRGVSQPLSLQALRFACRTDVDRGVERCGGDFESHLLRSEFGATFGLPLVADRVRLLIQVEATRQR